MIRKLSAAVLATVLTIPVLPALALDGPIIFAPISGSLQNAALDEGVVAIEWEKDPDAIFYTVTASSTEQATKTASTLCPSSPCSVTFGDLLGGVSYEFTVSAIDANDASFSNSVTFVARTVPASPGPVSAVGGVNSIRLTWTAPANNGGSPVTGYVITDGSQITREVDGDVRTLLLSGLNAGSSYTFQINAVNATGSSTAANFSAATVLRAPDAPTNVQVEGNLSTLTATWDAPASDGGSAIQTYTAYLQRGGLDVGVPVTTGNTQASFTGLAAGLYTVRVVATNIAGSSNRSTASAAVQVEGASLLPNPPQFANVPTADVEIGTLLTLSASAAASSVVTLAVSDSGACKLTAGKVEATAVGTCTVTATSTATSTHSAGTATVSFDIIATADTPEQPDPEVDNPDQPVNDNPSTSNPGAGSTLTSPAGPLTSNPLGANQTLGLVNSSGQLVELTPSVAQDGKSLELRSGAIAIYLRGGEGVVFESSGRIGIDSGSNFEFAAEGYQPNSRVAGYLVPLTSLTADEFGIQVLDTISLGTTTVSATGAFTFATSIDAPEGEYLLQLSGTAATGDSVSLAIAATIKARSGGSADPAYWPKKLTDTSVKLYAKNIIGVGKVQFFLNGREIAWVRAVDETDPKLRTANGFHYLVRTVELQPGMKNAVEIYVDGERQRRAAYTVR